MNKIRCGLVTLLLGLTLAVEALAQPQPFIAPQVVALDALRQDSASPLRVRMQDGFPHSLSARVALRGSTAVQRARSFIDTYPALFMLDHPDLALIHSRSNGDPSGIETVRFAQTFQGLPVFASSLVVLIRNDPAGGASELVGTAGALMKAANTEVLPPDPVVVDMTIPKISPATALATARSSLDVPSALVERGVTKLMIYDPSLMHLTGPTQLVWRVTVQAAGLPQFLIDAHDGSVVLQYSLAPTGAGLEDFDLDLENANGGNLNDTMCFNPTTIDDAIGDEFTLDTEWHSDSDARIAWESSRAVYLFFHNLGRHGYDDDDSELEVYVHANLGGANPNASMNSSCEAIQFDTGMVSRDIVSHETTHLVISQTSDLIYLNRPGALNESLADVFGALIDNDDWLVGESLTGGFGIVRDMADPTNGICTFPTYNPEATGPCNDPDRLSALITTIPGEDNYDSGGVHSNSGITNKAFFLLGYTGLQSFNGIIVNGIGRSKMAPLAYALATTLPSNADFKTARDWAVIAALDFAANGQHGYNSQTVCSVRNAFGAVEIGSPDLDCNGIDDFVEDVDQDGILEDGDLSGVLGDKPCQPGASFHEACDDNCPTKANPSQMDFDADNIGDACDPDDDNDGWPDSLDTCPGLPNDFSDPDDDGIPNCLDKDNDNDTILDAVDNCPSTANQDQFDGNNNGFGDACDPDLDGDGFYVDTDNCVLVSNPDQADADGDGMGDACDKCPSVSDNANAYTTGNLELGLEPVPLQPDSDGDGLPDACDNTAFGIIAGLILNGRPFSQFNTVETNRLEGRLPDSLTFFATTDTVIRAPIPLCETGVLDGPGANERIELEFTDLHSTVDAWIEDDSGRIRARAHEHQNLATLRGMRFQAFCERDHFLVLRANSDFSGETTFELRAATTVASGPNPWRSLASFPGEVPPELPDFDGDGLFDGIDNCPNTFDPSGLDIDRDGVGDACDICAATVIPEAVPTKALNGKRWALTGSDTSFDTAVNTTQAFSTQDTQGCSCEQIIPLLGLGNGHSKFGCSNSAMQTWVNQVNP